VTDADVPMPDAVALGPDATPITTAPKAPPRPRTGPKWEADAKERLRLAIKRFAKPLHDLMTRDANEGDTRLLVTDVLTYGLGYDKFDDLTTEYEVKGDFADYGVRIDKQLVAFIEVKRCATKLNEKHLRQVQSYAVNEGVEWLILTNGASWQVWHLEGGLPVALDLAVEVDLLDTTSTPAAKAEQLFYLSKEALKRRLIDDVWRTKRATSPKSLAGILLSQSVADAIRKELKRKTGQQLETSEVVKLLRDTVIRADCFG
jgi:predicted type IV restriction endonuclease